MPEQVIKSIIERNSLDENTSDKLLSEWRSRIRLFKQGLKNGSVCECIKPAEEELLFGGRVPVDIRDVSLTYTPQEYSEHIKNVIALSESNANYRFYALPDMPFTNVSVVVSENSVAATRLLPPKITFAFSHPVLCEAFLEYAGSLKEKYNRDKITTKRLLEKYI